MLEQEITKIVIATIKAMQSAVFAIPTDEFNNFKYPSLTINWDAKNQELVLKIASGNSRLLVSEMKARPYKIAEITNRHNLLQ